MVSVFFNSARSALYLFLKSLNLNNGDEVLVQGYTCVAVPNPVIWNNLKPVYVDINKDDFNIDIGDCIKKITNKTKVLIIQHSYGQAANIKELLDIAKKHNLIIIEDCALALGAKYDDKYLGTFADASIFSFSRDKVVSTVNGGMISINSKKYQENFVNAYKAIPPMSKILIFQSLVHLAVSGFIISFYNCFFIGKGLLILLQKLNFLNKAYQSCELRFKKPKNIPQKYSNILCKVLINQLEHLEDFNFHRRQIAKYYQKNLNNKYFKKIKELDKSEGVYLRYHVLVEKPEKIIALLKKHQIFLEMWYNNIIVPKGLNLEKLNYHNGDCPNAESVINHALNLPTHIKITFSDAQRIVDYLNKISY